MAMAIDDFANIVIQRASDQIVDYNNKVAATKSVSSVEEFQAHYLETSPTLKQFNDEIERLESALESVLTKRLTAATPHITAAYEAAIKDTGVDLTALDEQLKTIRSITKMLKDNYGDAAIEKLPDLERKRAASTTTATGEGGRRIRGFDVWVDGVIAGVKDKKTGKVKSTFSAASNVLGVDNTDLQNAFFEAAGGDDPKAEGFPAMVEFEFAGSKIKVMKQGDSDDE